ncbi:MAG: energy transducer TonB [Candidatus Melainabacteria bacterium]|nr:energy transducer TonB [Candidatus Melainabacteria bacterium]
MKTLSKSTIVLCFLLGLSTTYSAEASRKDWRDDKLPTSCGWKAKNEGLVPFLMCTNIKNQIALSVDKNKESLRLGPTVVREKFEKLLNNKRATCNLTLDKSGDISELKIHESTGSTELDNKILQLIRNCAPFAKSATSTPSTYRLDFPDLKVQVVSTDQ